MPIDRALENKWDKQLEERLPDSRLRARYRKKVFRAHMWWDPVYCANCGELKGLLTEEFSPHIFYLCDPCVTKLDGPPPKAIEVRIPISFPPSMHGQGGKR